MIREIDTHEWAVAIEDGYGVSLEAWQLYADRAGRVYAGSEYVARLGVSTRPQDAAEWADAISHFPRHSGRLETSSRIGGQS